MTLKEVLESRWGRFNDDPATPTSYFADSLLTAWLEIQARFGSVPADASAFRAWRAIIPELRLLDLRNADEQARHSLSLAELVADPAPPKLKDLVLCPLSN